MRILYSIAISLYAAAVRLAALFNDKAKLLASGWKNWRCKVPFDKLDGKVAWFHASSLGEFEQARPVIEAFRIQHPDFKICLTFFSPSGYEIRKNYAQADLVLYLPPDTRRNARDLVKLIHPNIAFFVKYDFWFNYLNALKNSVKGDLQSVQGDLQSVQGDLQSVQGDLQSPSIYLFSSIFRPNQYFFRWYGRWFAKQLHCYTHIFVQNEESLNLLHSIGITDVSVAGDTRYDRVVDIAKSAKPIDPIERFLSHSNSGTPKVLVAGSSWEPDERNIKAFIDQYQEPLKLILAPHLIDESHLTAIEKLFGKDNCVRFSAIKQSSNQTFKHSSIPSILIIDNIGMLSSIYQYATVAYIGGGFGKGIHNILEATAYGIPVCFGPNYHKFKEARDMIDARCAKSYSSPDQLVSILSNWLDSPTEYSKACQSCHQSMSTEIGSTKKILSKVRLLSLLLIALLATGCRSVDKFLQPDERVLNRNVFQIQMADSTEAHPEINDALSDMKKYVKQKPNTHVLSFGPRVSMYIYCLSNPNKDNFWHRYLRRKGQQPVIYDDNLTSQTCNQLTSLLNSKGCFNSQVTFDTIWLNRHDVNVIYTISPTPRYSISNVSFHAETSLVDSLLRVWRKESLLHAGDYYDQELMAQERSRIIERLRSDGFYLANTDLVSYTIDSAFEDNRLTIRMNIRNVVTSNGVRPLQKYHIDDIFIYPDANTSAASPLSHYDTLVYHIQFRHSSADYKFLYNSPMTLKPQTISRALMFFHGQTFRPSTIERTYNSLLGLRNFKYINIDLVESPNSCDSNRLLNARIRLMNTKRQRLSLSVEINNSSPFGENRTETFSGNMGLETKLTYQNKNLFGGAELLKTEWSLLVELPKLIIKNRSEELRNNVSSFENGLNFSLDLPTFLFPFTKNIVWQRIRPHTMFTFGANYQLHSYFERLLFNTGFGYNWQRRYNQHQLMPLELTYVRFFNIDSAFRNRMSRTGDARLKYQYSDHFIMNTRYDYIYNTQQFGTRNNFNYIHLTVETAGNLLNLLKHISGNSADESGVMKVFGVPFSQYVKINAELKRYFYIGTRSTLVARIIAGMGLPYGNSQSMPYEKSFFGGGPTTIRAWHLRHLGPGTFQPSSEYTFERIGDIQLVANLEYRFPLISILEGALFVDAGNVWLVNESEEFPGGKFSFKHLPESIATCVGLGIRANISIVTIRCDLALPFYDPGMESTLRLRPEHWKLSDITANFGIDYPF